MVGKTISHYRIIDKLGEGGMGVVYKAEDTKLHRIVALKFIRSDTVENSELKARFLNEAEAAAALNHPGICVVYEIDEAGEQSFIAMEYVEGESLAEKIKKRPLPLDIALDIASQIAEGLQAAHEKGIVHRDIKPANIMLDARGRAKIMDFGLAHLEEATRITQTGTSIGTPAYMSPEQVRGEKVGHRTDIWSLGVMLYEMVSGRLPFPGDLAEAVSHAVLYENPEPLTALRSGVPIELDWIVGKCLAKEPRQRYQHADELTVDLNALDRKLESGSATVVTTPLPTPTPVTQKCRSSYAVPVLGVLLALSLATIAVMWLRSPGREVPLRKLVLAPETDISRPVISPDGRYLAYTSQEKLWVQDLHAEQPRDIEGTEGAIRPFWAPDSKSIAFGVVGEIRRVSLNGGRPVRFSGRPPAGFFGASVDPKGSSVIFVNWNRDSAALFEATAEQDSPSLWSTPNWSGEPMQDAPHFLSVEDDRRLLLWTETSPGGSRILLGNLDSGEVIAIGDGYHPVYSSSGHIVYQTSINTPGIWAIPFSHEKPQVTGEAFAVSSRGSYPSVAQDGTLVYLDSGIALPEQLVWRSRDGTMLGTIGQPQTRIRSLSLSPKEDKVAVRGVQNDSRDLWVHEVDRPVKTRLTSSPGWESVPLWSPSGDSLIFTSGGIDSVFPSVISADGSGEPRILLEQGWADSWSSDGKKLIVARLEGYTYVEVNDEMDNLEPIPLPMSGHDFQFSPDGHWVAYWSDESGGPEVYVCEFPGGGNRVQVSTNGGRGAKWRSDGKELFYVEDWVLMAVTVTTTPEFRTIGVAEELFALGQGGYDVSADGQRFVVAESMGGQDRPVIRVVQNWYAEFEGRE